MALTKQQELALFEILEVPYQSSVHKLQPEDNLTAIEYTADNLATQAYILIQTKITEVEADADLLAVLQGYLNQWISLGTNVTNLQGGFGDINGVDDSVNRERHEIRGRVLIIVPFYRHHEELRGTRARNICGSIIR